MMDFEQTLRSAGAMLASGCSEMRGMSRKPMRLPCGLRMRCLNSELRFSKGLKNGSQPECWQSRWPDGRRKITGGGLPWAYALRRERSVEAAQCVLRETAELHWDVALIAFNLACYACVLGDLSGQGTAQAGVCHGPFTEKGCAGRPGP